MAGFLKKIFNKKRVNESKALPENTNTPELQYNYDEVIDYMEQNGGMQVFFKELNKIYEQKEEYYPSRVHGIDHTSRVTFFAAILATFDNFSEHDKELLLVAARYHDIGRADDRENKEHGSWGVQKAKGLDLLRDYSRKDIKIIEFAIEQHSLSKEQNEQALKKIPFWKRDQYKLILSYLKDADALDRVRILNKNMQLDPQRLRSKTAKQMVDLAHTNYREFGQIIARHNINAVLNSSEDFKKAFPFINQCFLDKQEILKEVRDIEEFQRNGVWKNCQETGMSALDIFEENNLYYAATQIREGDFEKIREAGYNITYIQLLEIISSYPEGVLDKLRSENRLLDIFSFETFKEYGKKDSFQEKLNQDYLNDEQLLAKINEGADVILLESTFKQDYMMYRNLYYNHRKAFELLVSQKSLNINFSAIIGILEVIEPIHLEILKQNGYNFRMIDLIYIASDFTPEKYLEIINSSDITQLFSYKGDVESLEFKETYEEAKRRGLLVFEQHFKSHYKLYKKILDLSNGIAFNKEFYPYPIEDIAAMVMKIDDAIFRAQEKGTLIRLTSEILLKILIFSKQLNKLDEKEQETLIDELVSSDISQEIQFVEYITKKNKVFRIESFKDLDNYNAFCIKQILESNNVSLESCKENLMNSLFNIDFTGEGNQDEVIDNIVNELYYYQKYKADGSLGINDSTNEQLIDTIIAQIIDVMSSQTIEEFKTKLSTMILREQEINMDFLRETVGNRMREVSKADIVEQLNQTKELIDNLPVETLTHNGENIPIKILDGQEFCLAVTTVMPKCSSVSKELGYDRDVIEKHILEWGLNKDNRCTSFIKHNMFAHAKSVQPDLEVGYAYVPKKSKQVSVTGNRDIRTIKKQFRNGKERVSKRGIVQNRKFDDIVDTTCEEHNEGVLNDVYPQYIICFDHISDLAIKKYKMLKAQYETEGIDQKIEIVVIKAKDKYLPQIDAALEEDLGLINAEMDSTGALSEDTIKEFLNSREQNITLRTIQAINCTSYRDSLWNEGNNTQKLNNLASTLQKVATVIPKEYIRQVLPQVEFILKRVGKIKSHQSKRFYDHSYKESVDVDCFVGIRKKLKQRLIGNDESRGMLQEFEQVVQ